MLRGKLSIGPLSCLSARKAGFQFGHPEGEQLHLPAPVVFGAGERMTFSDEGILGLSLPRDNNEPGTNIFAEAVRRGLLDAPFFTVHLRRCGGNCARGGLVTFGALDRRNCGPVRGWVTVPEDSTHWTFSLDGYEGA